MHKSALPSHENREAVGHNSALLAILHQRTEKLARVAIHDSVLKGHDFNRAINHRE